jgi:hypothetical protein
MIRFFERLFRLARRRSPGQRRLGVESLEDRLAPTATALSPAGSVVAVNPQPLPPGSPVAFAPLLGTTSSTPAPRAP